MFFIPLSPLLLSVHSGREAAPVRALLPFAASSWPVSLLARPACVPTCINVV